MHCSVIIHLLELIAYSRGQSEALNIKKNPEKIYLKIDKLRQISKQHYKLVIVSLFAKIVKDILAL